MLYNTYTIHIICHIHFVYIFIEGKMNFFIIGELTENENHDPIENAVDVYMNNVPIENDVIENGGDDAAVDSGNA